MKKIKELWHDFWWYFQSRACLCEYNPKDEKIYKKYAKKAREYTKGAHSKTTSIYPEPLVRFEEAIDRWLNSIPTAGHPDWEKMWLQRLMECDKMIRESKTREEVEKYQSIKDKCTFCKKEMEEKYQEDLDADARKCHCPKHRYTKNSG